jgi:oligopeptide/dipeptide ABC transporter ATP-binding protein
MATPELDIKNLTISFPTEKGELIAVNGISYQIHAGETLAIVGESGCGKTVNALSILRLIPSPPGNIRSGTILFRGVDILTLSARELRDLRGREIAFVFQDPMTSLNPVLSIGEQIIEGLIQHLPIDRTEAHKRAVESLRRVEIPSPEEKMQYYPHQLSGGMRQRVMIAMALACEPKILIADEPTTALDVLIQAQILQLLEKIKKQSGMSILLITHDLGIVTEIADRVLVMYAGEIVESGPVDQVFRSPLHPYTQGLKNSVPQLGKAKLTRLHEIPGNVPQLNDLPGGCSFHPRCSVAIEKCKTQKPQLQEIHPGRSASCWVAGGES